MKTQVKTTHPGRVLIGLLGLMFAQAAFAVGTPSATSISNDATVNFSSGGVAQTPVTSLPAVFVVDNMVDVLVAEISDSAALVVPGQLVAGFVDPQVLGFTVTNEGNTSQDYALAAVNLGDGAAVPFSAVLTDSDSATSDATGITMFVDDGSGTFDGADVVVTFLDAMAADETRTVWVVADIPAGAVNGAVIGVSLQATTHDSVAAGLDALTAETVGPNTPGLPVDVVFADDFPALTSTDDGAMDGQASDRDAFLVQSAVLTIVKASAVISDPFNGTTNPLVVPGAIVEYTITVTNTGAVQATTVSIADDLSVEIGAGRIAFTPDQYSGTFDIRLVINGGAPTDLTDAADADQGVFAANIVTVDAVTLNPADVAVVSFRVTIQ
ncbi:MAG: DUF11 domain-containing protein [Proteobacteria bacterium]|nr:DUF11 domain-containing protein [Pseudomonadota bacterium]